MATAALQAGSGWHHESVMSTYGNPVAAALTHVAPQLSLITMPSPW